MFWREIYTKKCDLSLTVEMGFGRVWLRKRREEMRPFLDMEREREREREAFWELEIRGERERERWAVCRSQLSLLVLDSDIEIFASLYFLSQTLRFWFRQYLLDPFMPLWPTI